MNGYLLDTNVISMLSPLQGAASSGFHEWLEQADSREHLFISVITIHEIERGITLLESKGATAKAAKLKIWLAGLIASYDDKVLGVDLIAASLGGRLEAKAISDGHAPGSADASIAGIAVANDLIVVTHNIRHFTAFGIEPKTPDEIASAA